MLGVMFGKKMLLLLHNGLKITFMSSTLKIGLLVQSNAIFILKHFTFCFLRKNLEKRLGCSFRSIGFVIFEKDLWYPLYNVGNSYIEFLTTN